MFAILTHLSFSLLLGDDSIVHDRAFFIPTPIISYARNRDNGRQIFCKVICRLLCGSSLQQCHYQFLHEMRIICIAWERGCSTICKFFITLLI
jgi:hypothetical protein